MTHHVHHAGCGCMAALSRRSLFGLGAAASAVAMAPRLAFAQKPSVVYEAMLMNCIDPRFTTFTWAYMETQGGQNLYSQFTIAGGPIAAFAPVFENWRKAWWDNLELSVNLHHVKRVVGVCHRDCSAAAVAYGDEIKKNPVFETAKLTEALRAFRDEVKSRQPKLDVQLGIQALSGAVEPVA